MMESNNNQGIKGSKESVYTIFSSLFWLQGSCYEPAKKMLFYSLIGNQLKDNIIQFKGIYEDTRLPFGLCISAAGGKKNFTYVVEETCKRLSIGFEQIVSLHPEQLVGTVEKVKKEKVKGFDFHTTLGYLASEVVLKDDALSLLNDPHHEDSRNYINTALDPIGRNIITKRRVNIPFEQRLKYEPTCSFYYYIQPEPIVYENMIIGFLRRAPPMYIQVSREERAKIINSRFFADHSPRWDEWKCFLEGVKYDDASIPKSYNWKYNKEALEIINDYTVKLLKLSLNRSDDSALVEVLWSYIHNTLLKMSTTVAVIENSEEIMPNHVLVAYNDFKDIWDCIFAHITQFIVRKNKIITNPVQNFIIDYLKKHRAFSFESSKVSVKQLKEATIKDTNHKRDAVDYHYNRLLKAKIIESKQKDQYDSRVWLLDNS